MQFEIILIYLWAAFFGLALGSFCNVVIYRYPRDLSIIFPPSHCPHCKSALRTADLVPLFSYIFLRGRCRYCKAAISFRYTAVELLGAFLCPVLLWRFGFSIEILKYLPLLFILLILSAIDLDEQRIPNLFVCIILAWGLLWQFISPGIAWGDAALGLLTGGTLTLLIVLVSRGGMGGGDVKLFAALGFLTGWLDLLLLFFIAVLLGAAAGIVLIIFKKKSGKSALPFGPFIAFAFFIVILWSAQIWGFYFSTL